MSNNLKQFGIAFIVFMLVDLVWLVFISPSLYKKYIGYLMAPQVNWIAALVFYVIFIAALVFFVLNPALAQNSFKHALIAGAFFGLVTYGTYDLTNLAVTKDWPLLITVVDLIWGTFVTSTTSVIAFTLSNKLIFKR